MILEQLEPEYGDDQIAEALYQREREWWHYKLDRDNFEYMIAQFGKTSLQGIDLAKRIEEIDAQMRIVEAVHEGLRARIRSPGLHAAAVERARVKRERTG